MRSLGGPNRRSLKEKISAAYVDGGRSEVVRRAYAKAREVMLSEKAPRPSLGDFGRSDVFVTSEVEVLLATLAVSTATLRGVQALPAPMSPDPRDRSETFGNSWPPEMDVGIKTSQALSALVTELRPYTVVETGVARGASTRVILQALRNNGHGELISFDISANVGDLVPDHLKERWQLSVLSHNPRFTEFEVKLRAIKAPDIYFHDGDHRYAWHLKELHLAWRELQPGGLLVTDDADASFAFLDFLKERGLQGTILVDAGKASGFVRKRDNVTT